MHNVHVSWKSIAKGITSEYCSYSSMTLNELRGTVANCTLKALNCRPFRKRSAPYSLRASIACYSLTPLNGPLKGFHSRVNIWSDIFPSKIASIKQCLLFCQKSVYISILELPTFRFVVFSLAGRSNSDNSFKRMRRIFQPRICPIFQANCCNIGGCCMSHEAQVAVNYCIETGSSQSRENKPLSLLPG